jgi:DNA-binding transcriptional LysR family regulator
VVNEYEPIEACRLLIDDALDLAVIYDYNLAPAAPHPLLETVPLWSAPWGLAIPSVEAGCSDEPNRSADLAAYANRAWIVNSRNTADEVAVRTLASLTGFTPVIAHQIDTLDLVEDLVAAGYGIALLPLDRPTRNGVQVLPLPEPALVMTAYAAIRRGRGTWPPLRLILDRLTTGNVPPLLRWPRSGA